VSGDLYGVCVDDFDVRLGWGVGFGREPGGEGGREGGREGCLMYKSACIGQAMCDVRCKVNQRNEKKD